MHTKELAISFVLLATPGCSRTDGSSGQHDVSGAEQAARSGAEESLMRTVTVVGVGNQPGEQRPPSGEQARRTPEAGAAPDTTPAQVAGREATLRERASTADGAGAGDGVGAGGVGAGAGAASSVRTNATGRDAGGRTQLAAFRARPGRRLAGRVELREVDGRTKLHVTVDEVAPGTDRLELYRARDCSLFGVGAGRFSSRELGVPSDLKPLGELRVVDGHGTSHFALSERDPDPAPAPRRAVVVYAAVEAHRSEVTEPIACAQLPSG